MPASLLCATNSTPRDLILSMIPEAMAIAKRGSGETVLVSLVLISRDPNGLPKTIRAFDASPWFEAPMPASEDRGEKGLPEGRRLVLAVSYRDVEGRKEGRP